MAGYTRQSIADIIPGNDVNAEPLNNEFNALQDAFHAVTGHPHDGSSGGGPKINLTTSVIGRLPVANGGIGGINKTDATTAPTVGDDNLDGYVVGSIWVDVTNDILYVCLDASTGAAVWSRYQPFDAGLTSIAGLTTSADQMIYTTALDVYTTTALTPFARNILDDADAVTVRGTIGADNATNLTFGTISDARLPSTMTGKTFSSGISVTGTATATLFSGSGASLTALNGSNISTGTVADARLPTTMAGKTFNGNTQVHDGNFVIRSHAPIIHLQESDEGNKNWFVVVDGTGFSIREDSLAIDRLAIVAGGGNNSLSYNGNTVWHAGNDGAGSGLDADVLDGQDSSFYRNASNMNAGTLGDSFLPTTMSAKTFNNSVAINSSGNSALCHRQNGVDRALAMFDSSVNEWQVHLYNNVGTWQRNISFDMETGSFFVGGFINSTGEVRAGTSVLQTGGNIEFAPGGWMATNYGPYLSSALDARIKNDGGTYNISVSGSARYVRAVTGQNLNFDWNGQSGQPAWLWGGNDGYNMYVYNPSNFSVNYANNAGNANWAVDADTVDGLHASAFSQIYYGTNVYETSYPVGTLLLVDGYVDRNAILNVFLSGTIGFNYSSGTQLAGTWRARGAFTSPQFVLAQRVA